MRAITNERDNLKDRIQKMKNKRLRVDINQKICKKCGKDFLENENYNWSCRTHPSEYNAMYWWCGKTKKDAQGCTIGKHESRDDEDDTAVEDKDENNKYIEWLCCKEAGHKMENCPKDPNYKHGKSVADESERLLHADEFSKHSKPNYINQISSLMKDLSRDKTNDGPFTVGSLKFDDYNYDFINPKVLISVEKMLKVHNNKEIIGKIKK